MNIAAITIAVAIGLLLFLAFRTLHRKAQSFIRGFRDGWRNGF
jgi:hypothetical protein